MSKKGQYENWHYELLHSKIGSGLGSLFTKLYLIKGDSISQNGSFYKIPFNKNKLIIYISIEICNLQTKQTHNKGRHKKRILKSSH